ncbi:MAG: hypothetical protein HC904_10720 [Blastochloris sp.]|nr:hypothetical protein [Blastochloris sp.]
MPKFRWPGWMLKSEATSVESEAEDLILKNQKSPNPSRIKKPKAESRKPKAESRKLTADSRQQTAERPPLGASLSLMGGHLLVHATLLANYVLKGQQF